MAINYFSVLNGYPADVNVWCIIVLYNFSSEAFYVLHFPVIYLKLIAFK